MNKQKKKGWISVVSADQSSRKKKEYLITPLGLEVFKAEKERLTELVNNASKMEEEK